MTEKAIRVIFICYGNACRSLMAERMCNLYGQGKIVAESAGTSFLLPDIEVDQPTIIEMKKIGLDVSNHRPRRYSAIDMSSFDLLINMSPVSDHDLSRFCQSYKGFKGRLIRWIVTDPRGKSQRVYGQVREDLKERVLVLIKELTEIESQKSPGYLQR